MTKTTIYNGQGYYQTITISSSTVTTIIPNNFTISITWPAVTNMYLTITTAFSNFTFSAFGGREPKYRKGDLVKYMPNKDEPEEYSLLEILNVDLLTGYQIKTKKYHITRGGNIPVYLGENVWPDVLEPYSELFVFKYNKIWNEA